MRLHPADRRDAEERTLGERVADRAAAEIGSWRFLAIQTTVLIAWVVANGLLIAHPWDRFPFILLNLCLSFQAAYTGPVLLLSQNRQAQKDRERAAHDYEVNREALEHVRAVRSHLMARNGGDAIGHTTDGGDW